MFFKRWAEKFSDDLAIDLGTANTLVFVRGEGIVLTEPSIVAIHEADHSIIAVGREAKAMLGRTPSNIRVIRPLKDGVIADFDITERMLGYFISQTHRWQRTILRPRVVVGVPSGITQVERRAVRDAAMHAGARAVYLVEEPVAAAMGAGLPIQEPGGNLIVDIGGGTTEVAVISLAGVIYCKSVRIAGVGRRGGAGGRLVRVPGRPRPPALHGRHRRGAGRGRPAGNPARPRPTGEPVHRARGVPPGVDRPDGAPGRAGRARVPRRARLDSTGGGPGPGRGLTLRQVDPLIRELTHYRDVIAQKTQEEISP